MDTGDQQSLSSNAQSETAVILKCSLCEKNFSGHYNYRRHLKRTHKMTSEKELMEMNAYENEPGTFKGGGMYVISCR